MLYLLPNNSPLTSQAFCWRPDSIGPYESLWSIFRKLAQLNATTTSGVIELLKAGRVISPGLKYNHTLDLLRFGSIDREQLAQFLQLDPERVYQASAFAYVKEQEIASLASEYLRYCPTCLRAGFHSPLHQFLFLKRCPAHPQERLTKRCATCKRGAVPYDMRTVRSQPAIGGECCLKTYGREGKSLTKEIQTQFGAVAQLLDRRCQMKTVDQPVERWLGPQPQSAGSRPKLFDLIGYWQDLLAPVGPAQRTRRDGLVAPESKSAQHITIASHPASQSLDFRSSFILERSLLAVYKSIYRRMTNTHLRPHRSCINCLMQRMWSDRALALNRGRICPQAHAFVLWRMFFERVQSPNQLTSKYRGRHLLAMVYWDLPCFDLPRRVKYRLFALECLAVFEECLLLTQRFHSKDSFSFNTGRVRQERLPYWSVQTGDGRSMTINWWPRSEGQAFPSMPTAAYKMVCSFKPDKWSYVF